MSSKFKKYPPHVRASVLNAAREGDIRAGEGDVPTVSELRGAVNFPRGAFSNRHYIARTPEATTSGASCPGNGSDAYATLSAASIKERVLANIARRRRVLREELDLKAVCGDRLVSAELGSVKGIDKHLARPTGVYNKQSFADTLRS